jgi:ParB family chromosome partitioning protein
MLTKRPSVEGSAWLKYEDDGHEFEAELSTVTLVALIEGA